MNGSGTISYYRTEDVINHGVCLMSFPSKKSFLIRESLSLIQGEYLKVQLKWKAFSEMLNTSVQEGRMIWGLWLND